MYKEVNLIVEGKMLFIKRVNILGYHFKYKSILVVHYVGHCTLKY